MKHAVIVHEFNVERVRAKVPCEVLLRFDVDGPIVEDGRGDVDGARRKVRDAVAKRFPDRRLHGLSAVRGGGFTVTVGKAGSRG